MDKLEYKGYYGSIEYSKEDDCLFGRVLGMPNNLISYEGNTATELHADFKEAINTYLEYCREKGIKPRKSYNGVLNIRIPAEIHGKIAMIAENTGTSINAFIRDSIERRIDIGLQFIMFFCAHPVKFLFILIMYIISTVWEMVVYRPPK